MLVGMMAKAMQNKLKQWLGKLWRYALDSLGLLIAILGLYLSFGLMDVWFDVRFYDWLPFGLGENSHNEQGYGFRSPKRTMVDMALGGIIIAVGVLIDRWVKRYHARRIGDR